MAQLSLGGLGGIVLAPDVLEEQRGAWCSPPEYTAAATERGPFDVDPFTNPRSTLEAQYKCMLERGDDGFGLDRRDVPGTFYVKPSGIVQADCLKCYGGGRVLGNDLEPTACPACNNGYHVATERTRVWIQPPYDLVLEALAHYGHTRFVALLRLDTSTEWFEQLWNLSEVIMVPKRDRLEFVPPPGVKASSNPFPHGLYYKRAEDVPNAIRALCYPWPCPAYPWASDPLGLRGSAAHQPVRWQAYTHVPATAKERPTTALHVAAVHGGAVASTPACGNPVAVHTQSAGGLQGIALACTVCLRMTERAA
ncbi:MAG TPA: hypothetical protein VMZ53_03685 [Kofleriaceae bacterium]|nr:hypothetical protein [Kofleriaceae bacterium]